MLKPLPWLTPLVLVVMPAWASIPLPTPLTAIVGAKIIDGNGGDPIDDGVILINGKRIVAIGSASQVHVPRAAKVINARGKFITPGFIDNNVHVSLMGGGDEQLWFHAQYDDIAIEGAQLELKYGVTTIRDSYGDLQPLLHARDAINSGKVVGPRMLVAGNIVGWGGPYAPSTYTGNEPKTYFQEQYDDRFAQGVGEELVHMTADEVRVAIDRYLDKGPDFIKFGGTVHNHRDSWLGFAPRVQEVIVEEAHKRGRPVETHSTSPEGLRVSVLAGIDLIQHPEVHMVEIPDELVKLIVDHHVMCSILSNAFAGEEWEKIKSGEDDKKPQSAVDDAALPEIPKTSWQQRKDLFDRLEPLRFKNAKKLIAGGCVVAPASDSILPSSPKLSAQRTDKLSIYSPGYGLLMALEGLVELGLTPMQALVAGTQHGAIAAHGIKDYGTLEVGKLADLLILDADPLADIKNIHKLNTVMKEGQVIDRNKLPYHPVLTAP